MSSKSMPSVKFAAEPQPGLSGATSRWGANLNNPPLTIFLLPRAPAALAGARAANAGRPSCNIRSEGLKQTVPPEHSPQWTGSPQCLSVEEVG